MFIILGSDNKIRALNFEEDNFYNLEEILFYIPKDLLKNEKVVCSLDSQIFDFKVLNFKDDDGEEIIITEDTIPMPISLENGDDNEEEKEKIEYKICTLDVDDKSCEAGEKALRIRYENVVSNGIFVNINAFGETEKRTSFKTIYNKFLSKITDDMYMELTPADTQNMLRELFDSALIHFEFPRVDIYNFNELESKYNIELSKEEIDIIATYMIVEWFGQQLASVENTRMKYSGSDFKFTSQANHMIKLLQLKKDYERVGFHLQRLYKRRKADDKGVMRSTFGSIMESSFKNKR